MSSLTQLKKLTVNNSVTLPDGSVKYVKYIGNVIINPNMKSHEVLYIPDFHFNLVSVHKLTESRNLEVVFNGSKCMMQDPLSKNVIAEGKAMKGLYWLTKEDRKATDNEHLLMCNSAVTNVFWHERLGHPSATVMSKLPFVQTFNSTDVCEICHVAKQTRIPFALSEIRLLVVLSYCI